MIFLRIIKESFVFALSSLINNKLRTTLSLLGITIGIFAIISVFTVLDTLKDSIKDSISTLGDNVVYVHKWPWIMNSHDGYPWWKFINRPLPSQKEQIYISKRVHNAEASAFSITTRKTIEYKSNSAEEITIWATSHSFEKVRSFEISEGRYFSEFESQYGKPIAIIGNSISDILFEDQSPIGKKIKVGKNKVTIVGKFEKEGWDLFNKSTDRCIMLPINYAKTILDIKNRRMQPEIIVKAKDNVSTEELMAELKGIMRSIRKLKPIAEDNFALNQSSLISQGFEEVFIIIDIAGIIIGGFSILVGGFGIANIMFVSVKERTKIIGIQKSLGSKNYFILNQILVESVFLSLLGGIVGLLFIFVGTKLASYIIDMNFAMSAGNIITGLAISISIGIISGLAPAISASRLNPVEAMNSNF